MNYHWLVYLVLISTLLAIGLFDVFFKFERNPIIENKGSIFKKADLETKYKLNDGFKMSSPKYNAFSRLALGSQPTVDSLIDVPYRGTWSSNAPGSFGGYFSQNHGTVDLEIQSKGGGEQSYKFETLFMDGEYRDGKLARVSNITLKKNISCSGDPCTWNDTGILTSRFFNEFDEDGYVSVPVKFFVQIINYSSVSSSVIKYNLTSNANPPYQLSISGTVTLDTTDYQAKAIYYSIMITLVCLVKLYSVIRLIKFVTESEIEGGKISILSIGFAQTCDTYWCLFHLFRALEYQDLFYYFITPTFWYFILCFIFDLRLIVMLWKIRYFHTYNNHRELRRGIIYFYVRLYFLMFGTLILLYFFILVNWLMIIFQLYLLPQIIHLAMKGQKPNLQPYFLFGFIGIRVVQPLYFRGCPHNILETTPSLVFCILVVLLICLQILIVLLQSKCGSRFFIPSFLLPPKFKYIVDYIVEADEDVQWDDCVICMNGLYDEPTDSTVPLLTNNNPDPALDTVEKTDHVQNRTGNRRKKIKKKIMRTPCGHRYHIPCLTRWMELKLECPTCRNPLPPLE